MTIDVFFPPPWAAVSTDPTDPQLERLVARLADELTPAAASEAGRFLNVFTAMLRQIGICAFASLVVPGEETELSALAWGTVSVAPGTLNDLPALVDGGAGEPYDWLDADGHPVIRDLTVRKGREFVGDDGRCPLILTARYAFCSGAHVALLAFESPSLAYREELTGIFDAVAETAAKASPGADPQ